MGHAIHFLQRLERSTAQQAERALQLYNQPKLVSWLLRLLHLDDEVERIALSLDKEDQGPFAVMTSEGQFVTCLGKGMSLNDVYLVRYQRLMALWKKAAEHRDHELELKAWEQETGKSWEDLFIRMLQQAEDFTQEDFVRLYAVQPVLQLQMFKTFISQCTQILDNKPQLLSKSQRPKAKDKSQFLSFWRRMWSLPHLAMLLTKDGYKGMGEVHTFFQMLATNDAREIMKDASEELEFDLRQISWPLFRQGYSPLGIRAIWIIGRLGKPMIAPLKKELLHSPSFLLFTQSLFGLACIGLRHNKLKPEITKLLKQKQTMEVIAQNFQSYNIPNQVYTYLLEALSNTTDFKEESQRLLRESTFGLFEGVETSTEYQYATLDDIPHDVTYSIMSNLPFNFITNRQELSRFTFLLPWLAESQAEELYLPKNLMSVFQGPWDMEACVELLRSHEEFYHVPKIPTRTEKLGRNDPCPCESGKKYKRCCMRKEE